MANLQAKPNARNNKNGENMKSVTEMIAIILMTSSFAFAQNCSNYQNGPLKDLKDYRFHRMICQGLLGIYLADKKLVGQDEMKGIKKGIVKNGGLTSIFFYGNAKLYYKLKELKASNRRVKESV